MTLRSRIGPSSSIEPTDWSATKLKGGLVRDRETAPNSGVVQGNVLAVERNKGGRKL